MFSGDCVNFCCFEEKVFKFFLYTYFFNRKNSNCRNSGMVGHRKLDLSMNNIFNVPSVNLHYTLSFKWPNFDLKCLVTVMPLGQFFKFKASVWTCPISETDRNCNSLFRLGDSELLLWNRKEGKNTTEHALFKSVRDLAGIELYL